ncbi:MAG: aminotransferase, partial [Dermatophilaceae bacterium]|nr:aminotransferase [Dermatophilaceae bacterium]
MTNPRTALASLSDDDLAGFLAEQREAYAALEARGLKLDLTRGKPSAAQLDLSNDLLTLPSTTKDRAGVDVRNYGGLEGLSELREMFAELLWVEPSQVVAGGNSSLTMMYSTIVDFLLFGGVDSPRPWSQEPTVKFICPVPGYDRHFSMLASFGIEMVTVDMHDDGPDVAAV